MTLYSVADMNAVLAAHERTMLLMARRGGRGSPADCAMRRLDRYRAAGHDAVVLHIGRKWALLRRPTLEQFNRLYQDGPNLMEDGATWSKVP